MHDTVQGQHIRLVAKLTRDVLAGETFETLADLRDAVKTRCSQLHLRIAPDDVARAFDLIGSNTELVTRASESSASHVERLDAARDMPRSEAATLYAELCARFRSVGVRSMPAPVSEKPRAADRYKAAQIVAQAILDSVARCEQLEREGEA